MTIPPRHENTEIDAKEKASRAKGERSFDVRQRLRQRRLARWRKRFFKHLPPVTLVLLMIGVGLGIGFVDFGEKVNDFAAPEPLPKADGIIVLTGGRARLESGLQLLEKGKGQRLLISGVNPVADSATLARATHGDKKLFDCCVDLGRSALNTEGNAVESAQWVAEHGYKNIYIVTNDYHMARSMIVLRRAMPDINLIAYPITQHNEVENSLEFIDRLRVLGYEYLKFLGVKLQGLLPG